MKQSSAFLLVLYMVFAAFQAVGNSCTYENNSQKSCCVSTNCCAKTNCCVGEEEDNSRPTDVLLSQRVNTSLDAAVYRPATFVEVDFPIEQRAIGVLPSYRPPPKQPLYIAFHKLILYA